MARKAYGRLSVLVQWRCEARIMFDVNASAFVPPPKVTSSIVRLVPRAEPLPCDRTLFERVTQAAFGQRRKMLRQSLRSLGARHRGAPRSRRSIEPTARAEDIAVPGFVALAQALAAAPLSMIPKSGSRFGKIMPTSTTLIRSLIGSGLEA